MRENRIVNRPGSDNGVIGLLPFFLFASVADIDSSFLGAKPSSSDSTDDEDDEEGEEDEEHDD